MIDFHCHIDLYPDPAKILDEADLRGTYVLAVTTTPKAWHGTRKLVGARNRVRVALGLHPEVVAHRHAEISLFRELLPHARYVGEIGIDGSAEHRRSIGLQVEIFNKILEACSNQGGRIMTIHSRGAATLVLDALESWPQAGIPILHWFSGSTRELDRAIKMGCWFSVGPAMMRSVKGRELASMMPVDRLLTETDAPFVRNGDMPLMPWQAFDCISEVSRLTGIDSSTLVDQIRNNLRTLPKKLQDRLAAQ